MFNRLRHTARVRFVRAVEQAFDNRLRGHQDVMHREIERVLDALREAETRGRRDVFAAGEREAVAASARFAAAHMPTVPIYHHAHATLEYAVKPAPSGGMALEFGVYSGTTLEIIARLRGDGEVFGFDSFQGLPEDWRSTFPRGTFGVDELPRVPGAELVVGWFDQTLPGFLAGHPGPVAFVHVDADLYSSATTILEHVGPRLVPGSVIIFDEYFNYPGWENHEHRAWCEYVERTGTPFRYEAYTANHEQVVVRITGQPTRPATAESPVPQLAT